MNFKKATRDLDLKSNEKLLENSQSPFAPKQYRDLKPKGFKIYTFNSGFKKKYDDLLILIFDKIVNVACKYSLTTMPAAPLIWDKKNNKGTCKALIVNSGNANAHTGRQGLKNIDKYQLLLKLGQLQLQTKQLFAEEMQTVCFYLKKFQ